jgi:hypothetical protein
MTWAREWWAAGHSGLSLMFRDYVVERMLGDLGWIGRVAHLHQRWDMFYRVGAEERGWHVVVATLEDGRQVSVLEHGRRLEGPTDRRPDSVQALYPSTRWATYFTYLRTPGVEGARKLLPAVIGRRWNREHPDRRIAAVRVLFVGAAPGGERREVVWYDGPPRTAPGPLAGRRPW